jgi:hypothetical protein
MRIHLGQASTLRPKELVSCVPPLAMQPAALYRVRRETVTCPAWSTEPAPEYSFPAPAGVGLSHDRQAHFRYLLASSVFRSER